MAMAIDTTRLPPSSECTESADTFRLELAAGLTLNTTLFSNCEGGWSASSDDPASCEVDDVVVGDGGRLR